MSDSKRVGVFLVRRDEAQLAWMTSARKEILSTPHEIVEYWAEDDGSRQSRQISDAVWQDKVDALLIMPMTLGGPAALMTQAVEHGKAVVLLNRTANDLNPDVTWSLPRLRKWHPTVLLARVAPDEVAIGRIQAQQAKAILPRGGSILCVQGDTMTSGAIDRTAGFEEILSGDASYQVARVDGAWHPDRAERAIVDWARVVLANAAARLDLVVSQSEVMLPGIRKALSTLATELGRPQLPALPLVGCDGHPHFQEEVRTGLLAATVQLPDRIIPAVRLCIDFWANGTMPPDPDVKLPPESFPPLNEIAARAQA